MRSRDDEIAKLRIQIAALKQENVALKFANAQLLETKDELDTLNETLSELLEKENVRTKLSPRSRRTLHAAKEALEQPKQIDSVQPKTTTTEKSTDKVKTQSTTLSENSKETRQTLFGKLVSDYEHDLVDAQVVETVPLLPPAPNADTEDDDMSSSDDFDMPLPLPPDQVAASAEASCELCHSTKPTVSVKTFGNDASAAEIADVCAQLLCEACATSVQRDAEASNSELLSQESIWSANESEQAAEQQPQPTEDNSMQKNKRRTIVAIQKIMELQARQSEIVRQRKSRVMCASCKKKPAHAKVTVRGSLSNSETISRTEPMCQECISGLSCFRNNSKKFCFIY